MNKNNDDVKVKPLNRVKIAISLILALLVVVSVALYDAYHVYILAESIS